MATYACTDLHGMYNLYEEIKKCLSSDDVVYFLGDANDRGPDGWRLIKSILADPQFIYLCGNHEMMFMESAFDFTRKPMHGSYAFRLLIRNGGAKTFDDWDEDEENRDLVLKLKDLPWMKTYKNKKGQEIILSHAGFTPYLIDDNDPSKGILPVRGDLLLWDRDHIFDTWDHEYFPNTIIVHGHTPIEYLAKDLLEPSPKPGAYWYCDNHKVCIDNCSFASGIACLLDLDTFEEILVGDVKYNSKEGGEDNK